MHLPRHRYLDPAQVEFDLGGAARRDAVGHRLHVFFGILWCFFLSWPTTWGEIASAPLIVFFALRIPNMWRTWGSFAVQPLTVLIAGWVAWQAASLAWSADPRQGLWELSSNRWVWVMWMLWPIMDRRMWFIAALSIGVVCGNFAQVLHMFGSVLGVPALVWPRLPGRNSGWWDPVVGGSLLVGALGLHLPAALMGRGRWRAVAVGGCLLELAAIGATGTRGAWIAAAWLCAVGVMVAVARVRPVGRLVGTVGMLVVVMGVASGVVWLAAGARIEQRVSDARSEVLRAEHGDFDSDTGTRVLMAKVAVDAFEKHPLIGVGAGAFRHQMIVYAGERGLDVSRVHTHAHAHDALLHIAATTGVVGLGLAVLIVVVALQGAFSELGPGGLGTYAAGPGFALVGLLLVSAFDPVQINAQTGAMLGTLMGMSLVSRPGRFTTENNGRAVIAAARTR